MMMRMRKGKSYMTLFLRIINWVRHMKIVKVNTSNQRWVTSVIRVNLVLIMKGKAIGRFKSILSKLMRIWAINSSRIVWPPKSTLSLKRALRAILMTPLKVSQKTWGLHTGLLHLLVTLSKTSLRLALWKINNNHFCSLQSKLIQI